MKFKIRFADQIVGLFIILSMVFLVFLIIMLGRTQRWFNNDPEFITTLPTAVGLSRNMAVQYRGFTIGNVKNFYLTSDDNVEVIFSIYEEYRDRARLGSMIEMMVSPIGLGSQFVFHSGTGAMLADGAALPLLGSPEATAFILSGLAEEPRQDDSLAAIFNQVNSILEDVDLIFALVSEALGPGSDTSEIGQIMGSLQGLMAGVEDIPATIGELVDEIQADITSILADFSVLTAALSDPDGLFLTALDTEGEVYLNLISSLASVSSILDSLDSTVAFIPSQLPQLAGIILELRGTLQTVDDVLVALTNNPLLRGGIPERPASPGISPRDLRF